MPKRITKEEKTQVTEQEKGPAKLYVKQHDKTRGCRKDGANSNYTDRGGGGPFGFHSAMNRATSRIDRNLSVRKPWGRILNGPPIPHWAWAK